MREVPVEAVGFWRYACAITAGARRSMLPPRPSAVPCCCSGGLAALSLCD